MEMPVDILTHRFGKIVDNGSFVSDYTALAISVDEELQEKFIFIPQEEIDAIEIEHTNLFSAGTGPENCQAGEGENPNWLYNHAMNALALYQHLKALESAAEKEEARLARRPEPGVYQGFSGQAYFTVIVPEDRRVLVQMMLGGLDDKTDVWDATLNGPWKLQRVDITDGTVSA